MNPFCRKRRHTLSGKLVILFIVMTALGVAAVGSVIAWSFRNHFEQSIRPHLMQYLEYIQADIGIPPDPRKAERLAKRLSLEIHYFGRDKQWATTDRPLDLKDMYFHRQFSQDGAEYGFGHQYDREYLVSRHPDYTLAFSIPHKRREWFHKVVPVIVVLVILMLLYHATRRLFAPIEQIKEGVRRIGGGELGHRLAINRRDELGELSGNINEMADDIEQMLEAKRQLLLAISHELRSPLTRAKVAVELLDDEKQRQTIRQDLNEMEKLIEELLETERLSTRHHILNKSTVVLQQLVTEVLNEQFPGNGFAVELPRSEIEMELDQARIKLLLKNILSNAMQHNPAGARAPELSVQTVGREVHIVVRDHGQGIEAHHLPHLAEPFYRTDKSRQRQTGGYGLGLYLCKVVAEAHGGRLKIESEINQGTVVTVVLPLESAAVSS